MSQYVRILLKEYDVPDALYELAKKYNSKVSDIYDFFQVDAVKIVFDKKLSFEKKERFVEECGEIEDLGLVTLLG